MRNSAYYQKAFTDVCLFVFGFLIVYPLSIRSVMALDQGIIFEAGARIAQGQQPFKNFYLPFGIIPSYIQGLLFSIFGISWKVYAIHACIINGFSTVIVYHLVKSLTSYNFITRLFIAVFTSSIFYTLPATPYADNHAMFFCLLAFWGFVLAKYKSPGYFFIVPLSLLLGFLSKQNPTGFYLVLFLVICLTNVRLIIQNFYVVAKSITLTIMLTIVLVLYWGWEPFNEFYLQMPASLGSKRMSTFNFNRFIGYYKLSMDGAKYLFLLLPFSILLSFKQEINNKKWDAIIIGTGIFIVSILAAITTMNQQQNAYSFLTLSVFIFLSPLYLFLLQKKKIFGIVFGFIIIICSLISVKRKVEFVIYRKFNDITYHYKNEQITYDKNIGVYRQELYPMGNIANYNSMITFLRSSGENFIWFGDASFTGSIIGNESVMPLIFYHPGLTYPDPEKYPERFNQLKGSIFRRMEKRNTKYLVVENERTYMGATLQQFWKELLPYGKVIRRFGAGKIYEIEEQFYYDEAFRKY